MQGIQNHDFASQVVALLNPLQERARGPDLVGFVRRSHRPQPPSALRSNGTDQLASLCMEQFFSIDGNNAILHRTQHLILPSQERQFQGSLIHFVEDPKEGRHLGWGKLARFFVPPPKAQRSHLPLGKGSGKLSQILLPPHHPAEDGYGDQSKHSGQRVTQSILRSIFRNLRQVVGQGFEFGALGGAARLHLVFNPSPGLGQSVSP